MFQTVALPNGIAIGLRGLPDLACPLSYGTFDIDGTLRVPPNDISPAVVEAIARFKDTGALVGIAPSPKSAAHNALIFVNVTPAASSPDVTAAKVASELGIDLSSMISFGDGNTDIPILSKAGIAVAMANGSDDVKQHTHLFAPSVTQDGVAVVLDFVMSVQARTRP